MNDEDCDLSELTFDELRQLSQRAMFNSVRHMQRNNLELAAMWASRMNEANAEYIRAAREDGDPPGSACGADGYDEAFLDMITG